VDGDRARSTSGALGRGADAAVIRVLLPQHLQTLAGVDREVSLDAQERPTQRTVLDALEASYPALRGTIRDHGTAERRDFIRFFACGRDITLDSADDPLPDAVASGTEPFRVVGAMAGG
jgi:molybdopterin synthase sulfur carrier subunit